MHLNSVLECRTRGGALCNERIYVWQLINQAYWVVYSRTEGKSTFPAYILVWKSSIVTNISVWPLHLVCYWSSWILMHVCVWFLNLEPWQNHIKSTLIFAQRKCGSKANTFQSCFTFKPCINSITCGETLTPKIGRILQSRFGEWREITRSSAHLLVIYFFFF